MHLRIFLRWGLATIAVAAVLASPGANPRPAAADMAAVVDALPAGPSFSNDGQPYVWLPTLAAVRKGEDRTGAAVGAPDAAPGSVLAEKGRFIVYAPQEAASEANRTAMAAPTAAAHYPVVFNRRTGRLGVVSRKLWLKLDRPADAAPIADAYSLQLAFVNPVMKTAFYTAPAGLDLHALRNALSGDPRVARVTLEIIDRTFRPR